MEPSVSVLFGNASRVALDESIGTAYNGDVQTLGVSAGAEYGQSRLDK